MHKDCLSIAICLISNLNLGSLQKANILFVLLGLRTSTYVDVYTSNDPDMVLKAALKDAGLCYADLTNLSNTNSEKLLYRLAVAKDQDTANRLQIAGDSYDDVLVRRLFGYPSTAIEAFIDESFLLQTWRYPKDVKYNVFLDELFNPLGFRLSIAGVKQEANFIRRCMVALKEYMPKIYDELNVSKKVYDEMHTSKLIRA